MERERLKEPDVEQLSDYDKGRRRYQEWADRMKSGALHIPATKRDYQKTRQGYIRYFLNALFTDTALSTWAVFEQLIKSQSGRHNHQGGIIIYVLEGVGYSMVDGERKDWKKGDLILLPMKPEGVVHQHFNLLPPDQPALWVAFLHIPLMEHLASELKQEEPSPEYVEQQNAR